MLNPSMGIRSILSLCSAKNYTFSANSKLSFSTGYTTSIGDMMTLLTEPMQVDYRSVRTSSRPSPASTSSCSASPSPRWNPTA